MCSEGSRLFFVLALGALGASALACESSDTPAEPDAAAGQLVEYEDEGRVCTSGDHPHTNPDRSHIEAGEPFDLAVVFNDCRSSSCTEFHDMACEVELAGDTLVVTSEGSYTDYETPGRICTDDCAVASATCAVPGLDEGSYTLQHGDEVYTFDVPGDEDEPACLEE